MLLEDILTNHLLQLFQRFHSAYGPVYKGTKVKSLCKVREHENHTEVKVGASEHLQMFEHQ